jgi:hypothetical protein
LISQEFEQIKIDQRLIPARFGLHRTYFRGCTGFPEMTRKPAIKPSPSSVMGGYAGLRVYWFLNDIGDYQQNQIRKTTQSHRKLFPYLA